MSDTMTEREADGKWCPFAMAATSDGESVNRGPRGIHGNCRCVASACMAWRTAKMIELLPSIEVARRVGDKLSCDTREVVRNHRAGVDRFDATGADRLPDGFSIDESSFPGRWATRPIPAGERRGGCGLARSVGA
jgi:hypothetical protein